MSRLSCKNRKDLGLLLWSVLMLWGQLALAQTPTLWFKFDENTGTSVANSGSGPGPGTLGAATAAPIWVTTCQLGPCLQFDATNDIVTTGQLYSSYLSNTTGALMAWVKATGTPANATAAYNLPGVIGDASQNIGIHRGTIGGTNDGFYTYLWDGAEKRLRIPYTNDVWTHVTLVHGGGNMSAYKDGVQVAGSPIAAGNNTVTGGVIFGSNTVTSCNCQIDDVRIYSTALTGSEILAIIGTGPPAVTRRVIVY